MCSRCTLTRLIALLLLALASAVHTCNATAAHIHCQQMTSRVNTSSAAAWRRWWWTAGQVDDGAHAPPPGHSVTTHSITDDGEGEEDGVVFTVAFHEDTPGKEVVTVNLNIDEYIKLLTCLSDPNVYICTIATNSSVASPNALENLPRFEQSSQNVTCGYNLTVQSLHCSKLNESVTESFGVFHLYNNESDGTNVSIYLSWDARQEVVSVSYTELLDIHFTCLAGGEGRDDQGEESSLPYNIAGSAMAVMVIVLFVITVWQTVRKRKQQEEKMKSTSVAVEEEEEVEKEERNMSSQAQLVMVKNNGLETDEAHLVMVENNGFEMDETQLVMEENNGFEMDETQLVMEENHGFEMDECTIDVRL